MNLRLNGKLAAALLAAAAVLGLGGHFLRGYQMRRNAHGLLRQADRAEEAGRPDRALHLLGRYIRLNPADTEARVRFGWLLDRQAQSVGQKRQVMAVFEQVLLRDPDRHDVRRRHAVHSVDVQDFDTALTHLEVLKREFPKDAEVALLLARATEGKALYPEAARRYREAIALAPAAVEAYVRLAGLLRRRLADREGAERVMAELVAKNPGDWSAYVERAAYVQEFDGQLAAAADDVATALRLARPQPRVLLLAGQLARERNDLRQARVYLREGLRRHPRSVPLYQAVADLELATPGGRPRRRALAWLRQGLNEVPGQVALLAALADLLIQEGELTEARAAIAQLRQADVGANELTFLEAQALAQEGKWSAASRLLEDLRPQLVHSPALVGRADLLLGRCYRQLNDDRQLAVFRRAAARDPHDAQAAQGLAAALLSGDRLDDACAEYERLMRLPNAPAAGWATLAQIHILRNLQAPADRRDWERVREALSRAEKVPGQAGQVALMRAEVLAAEADALDGEAKAGKMAEARKLLEAARDKEPTKVEYRLALAGLAARAGRPADVFRTLDEAERAAGDGVPLRLARARYARLATGAGGESDRVAVILATAERGADRFAPAERAELLRGLAEGHAAAGRHADALRLGRAAAELRPAELPIRLFVFDAARRVGSRAAMDRALEEIRSLSGEGPLWHYGQARLLAWQAAQGDRARLAEARRHLNEAARRRPAWSRVPLLRAEIAELEGRPDEVIDGYQQALALGDRQAGVIDRLVKLLYDRRRYAEAENALARLRALVPISPGLQRLAAEASLHKPDFEQAQALARAAVARDSTDPRDHLWLSRILFAAGKRTEAEAPLRRAVALAPAAPEPWVALVQYLVAVRRPKDAQAAIDEARRKVAAADAPLALARCYEAVGDMRRAEEQYRAAVAGRPSAAAVRAAADFFLRARQPTDAVPHLRRLAAADGTAEPRDRAWARRGLALTLATSGDYRQFQEALRLLGGAGGASPSLEDQRTRAIVLASHNGHSRAAVRELEALARRGPLTADLHFRLGKLYEAAGDGPRARDALQGAVALEPRHRAYLTHYAVVLLRQGRRDEAAAVLGRLRGLGEWAFEPVAVRARLLAMDANADELTRLVGEYVRRKDAQPADAVPRRALAAVLLDDLGREFPTIRRAVAVDAERLYRQFASATEETRSDGTLALIGFLGRQGRSDDVLAECERAWRHCRPEAVAAAAVAALHAAGAAAGHYERLERALRAEVGRKPGSPVLLEAVACAREYQGRYDDAEALYRQVLRARPRSATALNNLAYLLALRGEKSDEALELIDRALAEAGPAAELRDTRAVVRLARREADRAVTELREALGQKPLPSSVKFHLAQAYLLAGDRKAAAQALGEARAAGLTPQGLHPLERPTHDRLRTALAEP